ncbi:MAG: hypothetical protein K5866_03430 [Treponema sp.]|nr:hypothetical protein [Treponema sp.]
MKINLTHKIRNILFLLLCGSLFFSCHFNWESEENENRPDIDNTSTASIKVTLQKLSSDTKYINIYRKDSAEDTYYAIGIVYPAGFDSNNTSYLFEDFYVLKDHKYSYMARYTNEDGSVYTTNWTDSYTYSASSGADSYSVYKYSISDTKITFDDTDNSLKFQAISGSISVTAPSGISDFSTNFVPALVIATSSKAQTFELTNTIITTSEKINLRGLLPEGFYDEDLSIVGLLGQRTEKNSDDEVMRVYWTLPTSVPVYKGSSTIETFSVSSEIGDGGLDYSNPE